MKHSQDAQTRIGLWYGLAAYFSWGIAPAYYKLLVTVPPLEVLTHRIVWSVIILLPFIWMRRLWPEVLAVFRSGKTLLSLIASAIFVSINWYTFVHSVSTGRVLESSLGYYMSPLVVVVLGVLFLKERLRLWQTISITLAGAAVLLMTINQGRLPVISLTLAVSFALYGLVRKLTPAGPMVGLFIETLLMLPVAVFMMAQKTLPVVPAGKNAAGSLAILAFAGVMTALPLLWFANAAKRLRMTTLGLLQYIAPTCTFTLALVFFGETIRPVQYIAFPMIWVALVVYSIDSFRGYRANQRAAAADEPVLTDL